MNETVSFTIAGASTPETKQRTEPVDPAGRSVTGHHAAARREEEGGGRSVGVADQGLILGAVPEQALRRLVGVGRPLIQPVECRGDVGGFRAAPAVGRRP